MSLIVARRKRTALYLSIVGLVVMVAAVSAISARDPSGVTLRIGMVMVTVGAAMFLPWYQLLPAVILTWFAPNLARGIVEDYKLFNLNMILELPGLLGLGAFATFARESLRLLEQEMLLVGSDRDIVSGMDPKTGVYKENRLRPDLEAELARSRRFGRTFALVLVGIDAMRQRFDYRNDESWDASLSATAELLRGTRNNVDRVYTFGTSSYALLLPESGEKDVKGLVGRLRRTARKAKPSEGEPGGPFPVHYGATFFPACATSSDDLLRRAEIAMRIAEKSPDHLKLDTAAAPEMAPVESLRRRYAEEDEMPLSEAATALNLEPQARQLHVLATGDSGEGDEGELSMLAEAAEPSREPEFEPEEATPPQLETVSPIATRASVYEQPQPEPVSQQPEQTPHLEPEPVTLPEPELAPVIAFESRLAAEPPALSEPVTSQAMQSESAAAAPVELEPVLSEAAQPQPTTAAEPASLDEDITDLLAHLDQTLDMIRTMRTPAA
jgi:GGDEF domain-containing protein